MIAHTGLNIQTIKIKILQRAKKSLDCPSYQTTNLMNYLAVTIKIDCVRPLIVSAQTRKHRKHRIEWSGFKTWSGKMTSPTQA